MKNRFLGFSRSFFPDFVNQVFINGFYQTEYQDIEDPENWHDVTRRETLEGAETAIDQTVAHYLKKVEFIDGPKIVKTFK